MNLRTSFSRRTARIAAACGFVLIVGASCDRADDAPPSDGLATFVVSDTAVLVLEDDGTPEKMFARIAARRLPDGTVVVADAGSASIHVFGRDGGVVRRLARRGGGPGEIQGDVRLAVRGDTVLAFGQPPLSAPGITVYAAHAGFVRHERPPAERVQRVSLLDALDSALLVRRGGVFRALNVEPDPAVLRPDSSTYGIATAGSDSIVWLPATRDAWYVAFPWPGGPIPHSAAPFPQRGGTHVAAAGDRVWFVNGETGDVRAFDASAREVVATRLPVEPRPHDAAALDRRLAHELLSASRALDSSRVRAQWGSAHRPPTAPLADAVHGTADGGVWVREWTAEPGAVQHFVILDRDGRTGARTTVPAGLDVHHVGRDFVLGVRRDSLGVESVHEHAVRWP